MENRNQENELESDTPKVSKILKLSNLLSRVMRFIQVEVLASLYA